MNRNPFTTDQCITLAERLASGLGNVKRGDWNHWVQLVEQVGLKKSLDWADRMANDPTLRPNIKAANKTIADVGKRSMDMLQRLSPADRRRVFGYVAQRLLIHEKLERWAPGPKPSGSRR